MHPENSARMPRTVFLPDAKNHDKGRDRQKMSTYVYPQYKSPEYKEPSNAKAYALSNLCMSAYDFG